MPSPPAGSPDDERSQQIRHLILVWRQFDESVQSARGRRDGRTRNFLHDLRVRFLNYGDAFIVQNPDMQPFWTSVIRPDIGLGNEQEIAA